LNDPREFTPTAHAIKLSHIDVFAEVGTVRAQSFWSRWKIREEKTALLRFIPKSPHSRTVMAGYKQQFQCLVRNESGTRMLLMGVGVTNPANSTCHEIHQGRFKVRRFGVAATVILAPLPRFGACDLRILAFGTSPRRQSNVHVLSHILCPIWKAINRQTGRQLPGQPSRLLQRTLRLVSWS
jgi:hypothetical protein